jgi:hypothetical protein
MIEFVPNNTNVNINLMYKVLQKSFTISVAKINDFQTTFSRILTIFSQVYFVLLLLHFLLQSIRLFLPFRLIFHAKTTNNEVFRITEFLDFVHCSIF